MVHQYTDYTRRLEHLLEVCRDLPSNLDLQPLLNSVIETASDLSGSQFSLIFVFNKEKGFLQVIAAPFYMQNTLMQLGIPADHSIAGRVYETKQPMLYNKSQNSSEPVFNILNWEINEGYQSVLAVPLTFKGECFGVLAAVNKINQSPYNDEDILFLDTLASQAATAIRNSQLIDEAEKAYQKVMELDRMKSDFIAIASHELRTPLGLIMGHAGLMDDTATPAQKEDLATIRRSADRLRELIEQLANIDELTVNGGYVRREKVNLNLLIQRVVDSFLTYSGEKRISIAVNLKQPNLWVEGDEERIAIALRNLVKNALQFTASGGGKVLVTAEQLPGYVKIAVIDNGIGIPAGEQEKIFNRFYQVEKHLTRRHGGMGLGLSIAREMITLHGGKITVESVEAKGSRFTIFLPNNAAQVSAAEKVFL